MVHILTELHDGQTNVDVRQYKSFWKKVRLLITDEWRDSMSLFIATILNFFHQKWNPLFNISKDTHTCSYPVKLNYVCMHALRLLSKHYSESIPPVGCAGQSSPTSLIKGWEHRASSLLRRLFLHLLHPGSTGATRPDCTGQKPSSLSGFSCSIWFQP